MSKSYKVVLLGDTGVGKSSLVSQFVNGNFFEFQEPTIGAAFMAKQFIVDSQNIKVEIWDTAGQERYKSLAPMYYRGATLAVIVYDITRADSLAGANFWLKEIRTRGSESCIITLVGNKSDLEHKREVSLEEGMLAAQKFKCSYFATSAKDSESVIKMFKILGRKLLAMRNVKEIDEPVEFTPRIRKVNSTYCCYKG